MQYLRAMAEFWREPDDNPEAALYAGKMVNPDRMFVWACDMRPFPHFPGTSALWSDGENYARALVVGPFFFAVSAARTVPFLMSGQSDRCLSCWTQAPCSCRSRRCSAILSASIGLDQCQRPWITPRVERLSMRPRVSG